ncbi:hypothetical protein CEXT_234491 [Caerostris extrusa]|uniref:Uncharacterized protein n=1 Tax=Caerostris extrusa TaxID=172846 RepID=A0AAV4N0F0_CAEEX|nr:hypothetical protein CEXT_234491 [Caerostris extrusa]
MIFFSFGTESISIQVLQITPSGAGIYERKEEEKKCERFGTNPARGQKTASRRQIIKSYSFGSANANAVRELSEKDHLLEFSSRVGVALDLVGNFSIRAFKELSGRGGIIALMPRNPVIALQRRV